MNILKRIWQKLKKKSPTSIKPSKPTIPEIPQNREWNYKFVDSSHHHPDFNPAMYQVSAPILLHKCTQGLTFIDKEYKKRRDLCRLQGILYGGYHFYQCYKDPIKQAEFYCEIHGKFDFIPIVDFETQNNVQDDNDLIKEREDLYKMLVHLEYLTGKTPMIYSGYALIKKLNLNEKYSRFPLWVARYNMLGEVPKPFNDFIFWQYSDKEYFSGIGNCDVNLYNHKSRFLDAYLKGGI